MSSVWETRELRISFLESFKDNVLIETQLFCVAGRSENTEVGLGVGCHLDKKVRSWKM